MNVQKNGKFLHNYSFRLKLFTISPYLPIIKKDHVMADSMFAFVISKVEKVYILCNIGSLFLWSLKTEPNARLPPICLVKYKISRILQ